MGPMFDKSTSVLFLNENTPKRVSYDAVSFLLPTDGHSKVDCHL
jgi:hypothetical protein